MQQSTIRFAASLDCRDCKNKGDICKGCQNLNGDWLKPNLNTSIPRNIFSDIYLGSKVIHHRNDKTAKLEVTRLTKTMIICGFLRFNRKTGKCKDGSYIKRVDL